LVYYRLPKLTVVDPSLSVSPSNKDVSSSPGTTTPFLITSNTDWTISDNSPWLTTSINSGSGIDSFTASCTENTLPDPRTATITVAGSGIPDVEVIVAQQGSSAPLHTIVHNTTIIYDPVK